MAASIGFRTICGRMTRGRGDRAAAVAARAAALGRPGRAACRSAGASCGGRSRVGEEVALAEAAWRGDEVLLRAHVRCRGRGARRRAGADALRALPRRRRWRRSTARSARTRCSGGCCAARPGLRVPAQARSPFEALAWAVIEQVITTRGRRGGSPGRSRARTGRGTRPARGRAPPPSAFENAAALQAAGLRAAAGARTPRRAWPRGRSTSDATGAGSPRSPGVGEWTLAHLDLFGLGPLRRAAGARRRNAQLLLRAWPGCAPGSVERGGVRRRARTATRPWQGLAAAVPGGRRLAERRKVVKWRS